MNLRFFFLFILIIGFFSTGISQTFNYKQINIQGQLFGTSLSSTDFEFLVLALDGDTLFRESHAAVPVSTEGAFTVPFGNGTFITGEVTQLFDLNWLLVDRVELYHIGASRYLQGAYNVQAVPYTLHSLKVLTVPSTSDLSDVEDPSFTSGKLLKYNGLNFILDDDDYSDTANLALYGDSVAFADTVWFAFNNDFADTAFFAYYADSAIFADELSYVSLADSSAYTDSVSYANYSIGNWGIAGNAGLTEDHFLGSTTEENLVFRTNNNNRFTLGTAFEVNNNSPGIGFRLNAPTRGVLFTPNVNPGVDAIDGAYFYFDGQTRSFHGGTSLNPIDTLKGNYSFAFGENVGTNGTYSTVFGYNTFGDTAIFSGTTPYASISSFALGRNCRVAHMSVAIGDSAIASYYRNIAVGKNVVSKGESAGIAIGNNVFVTGATSWAVGHNLTATGNFATAIGTNASTSNKKGGFIFGDFSTTDTVVNLVDNQFMARAAGGVIFYSSTDLSMGVQLSPGGGSWSMISDRSKKTNIQLLSPLLFQQNFDSISVFQWNYIGQSTLHIGPMAQDFYAVFQIGERNDLINMIDADGVSFLGIKMIYDRLKLVPSQEAINELDEQIRLEQEALDDIERRINELYEKLD